MKCHSEDTYSMLKEGLTERLNDKETLIRAHAAAALSKLVGSEDPEEMADGEQPVLDILLEVLATDPAACAYCHSACPLLNFLIVKSAARRFSTSLSPLRQSTPSFDEHEMWTQQHERSCTLLCFRSSGTLVISP